jgi:hypothetical protein
MHTTCIDHAIGQGSPASSQRNRHPTELHIPMYGRFPAFHSDEGGFARDEPIADAQRHDFLLDRALHPGRLTRTARARPVRALLQLANARARGEG